MFFFFQAEDGIRDLVRSRGLGDVYKRQPQRTIQRINFSKIPEVHEMPDLLEVQLKSFRDFLQADVPPNRRRASGLEAVSYTHLTLPTSDLV